MWFMVFVVSVCTSLVLGHPCPCGSTSNEISRRTENVAKFNLVSNRHSSQAVGVYSDGVHNLLSPVYYSSQSIAPGGDLGRPNLWFSPCDTAITNFDEGTRFEVCQTGFPNKRIVFDENERRLILTDSVANHHTVLEAEVFQTNETGDRLLFIQPKFVGARQSRIFVMRSETFGFELLLQRVAEENLMREIRDLLDGQFVMARLSAR